MSRVQFSDGSYRPAKGWTFIDHANDRLMPATELVGKVVNIGHKNGPVFDGVTVTEVTDDGHLMVTGGRRGNPYVPDVIVELGASVMSIMIHDVARGYVHDDDA